MTYDFGGSGEDGEEGSISSESGGSHLKFGKMRA